MELFSRFKLDVRRTSFKPAPFSDTSLITLSHILYSMSTGFSDGKERVKKLYFDPLGITITPVPLVDHHVVKNV